ncbi:hypothetical protein EVAR_26077_1 [Eumeta japonica]|uniref:MSP domain-containing protein n=1 Tax=Eumeta variegata TaxID=151549 RepID=A0A4C2AB84_EUMVA|nr:hypothetical protein EVAR_26077_1 [Eumeta japonica]
MPNQVLIIEPQNELKFKVDFTGMFQKASSTYMKLTNPSNDTVLFKIKTTAPKKYCVRPNSGVLEPNSKVEIAITPPAYVEPNDTLKHKFMVQSVVAPEGKTNIDQVWKEINPEQLMDYKLKCVFETPQGVALPDSGDASDANKKRVAVNEESKPLGAKDSVESFIQNEAKTKLDDDFKTSTPIKAAASPKSEYQSGYMRKATSEITQLREEESKLRHENVQLKEEILRLRMAAGGDGGSLSPHSFNPEKTNQVVMMPWLIIAVGMAFFGIIIGKFFI